MIRVLKLETIHRDRHQLAFQFSVDGLIFNTTYWYDTVDFFELENIFGKEFLEKVYFHIAAFEINKIASLRPQQVDWGNYTKSANKDFEKLWLRIFQGVWAQWRFENDDQHYLGPEFKAVSNEEQYGPVRLKESEKERMLSFCGGGKDSLVSGKILKDVGVEHDYLVYSSSIYGLQEIQHQLINKIIDQDHLPRVHRQWVFDDFLDSPVLNLYERFGVKTKTAAETPSSIFASLPIALAHSYKYLVLGHEKSADVGQVVWKKTGEDVNHQWGKSFEAETLLNDYLKKHLVENLHYFSILKPIYDPLIFTRLRKSLSLVPYTHSCNIDKPWCCRCAKCAYVFINYLAYLPEETVKRTFGKNLSNFEEDVFVFRELLGLEKHLPFECIGQQEEVLLAFAMCSKKGVKNKAVLMFEKKFPKVDILKIAKPFYIYDMNASAIPEFLKPNLEIIFKTAVEEAWQYLRTI